MKKILKEEVMNSLIHWKLSEVDEYLLYKIATTQENVFIMYQVNCKDEKWKVRIENIPRQII